jgi:hypothetical protein
MCTGDGGATWTKQSSGTTASLYGVSFTDPNTGTVVGPEGVILRTTNGGGTWTRQPNRAGSNLNDVHFTNATTGIAVGSGGTILHTTTGGMWVEDTKKKFSKAPTQLTLSQNYPNPFNPSTTIEYQIPRQSLVTLRIFDLLGREVVVLVNEIKQAGTHSVKWDASRLSSGVYFYTITAGSYRETKRMILMK